MTPEVYRARCDALLLALLGRREAVDKWWRSPNAHWHFETPEQIFEQNAESVYSYLLTHYDR
jgi:hypothetical protein